MEATKPVPEMLPEPGSPEELRRFGVIQRRLPKQFESIWPKHRLPRTVICVPSLSLDQEELRKIPGAAFYEERLLCILMLLRLPNTKVIYLTSMPVHPSIVDYYLHLLPGIPVSHARRRLCLLSCHDSSSKALTEKLLDRPRLLKRIQEEVIDPVSTHITCYNSTPFERSLAVRLGYPLFACDPSLVHLGDKSHGREIMREAGIQIPDGFEHLRDAGDLGEALYALKKKDSALIRAVVKLNEGFSGEGNAIFSFEGAPETGLSPTWIQNELPKRLSFEAKGEEWERYEQKFKAMRGIAEVFIEAEYKRSPTARTRINPIGEVEVVSTQDQILGGPSGQIYQACRFPADAGYRIEIQNQAIEITKVLRDRGILGQTGIDFLCCKKGDSWEHFGIELNIRKGGATHPYLMLQFLTDGHYDVDTATYKTATGRHRCYYASDNLEKEIYQGLTPDDLIDIAVENEIHFHGASQTGVVFHLIGALSRFGKLGLVSIDQTLEGARKQYESTMAILDREAKRFAGKL